MSVQTSCPHCRKNYNLADSALGKQVRCKKCGKPFTVKERSGNGDEDDDYRDKVSASRSRLIAQDKAATAHRRREEDYEDEEAPRRRPARDDDEEPQEQKSNVGLIIGLSAGGVALIGVIVAVILIFVAGKKTPEEQLAEEMKAKIQNLPNDMKNMFDPNKLPNPEDMRKFADNFKKGFPNPNDDPFKPNPDRKPPAGNDLARRLEDLKGDDAGLRNDAVRWFGQVDPNVPRRPEVAQVLEKMALGAPNDTSLARAYLNWATKDQVPTIITLVDDPNGERRVLAMAALGRLKDERGVEPMINKLKGFDRDAATRGLQALGDVAAKGLVKNLLHRNNEIRQNVQNLVRGLNLKEEGVIPVILGQLKAATDPGSKNAASEWFVNSPPGEKFKKDVALGLDPLLEMPDTREAAVKALEVCAVAENIPTIAKWVAFAGDVRGRDRLIKILSRFKDETAAKAVATRLGDFFDRGRASEALQTMGSVAEKAVLPYLYHKDGGTRQEAKRLLDLYKTTPDIILDQTIKALKDPDGGIRRVAVQWLEKPGNVDEKKKPEVVKALEPLLNDPDAFTRGETANAFFKLVTKDQVPALIKMVEEPGDSPHRHRAIAALGTLKDEKGAVAVANRLPNFFDRGHASKALKAMGPIAEKAVIPALYQTDGGLRIEGCRILAVIGTAKVSIPHLKKVVFLDPKNRNLLTEAVKAAQTIQASGR